MYKGSKQQKTRNRKRLSKKEFENLKDLPKINTGDLYDFSWGAQETKLIKEYDELMK